MGELVMIDKCRHCVDGSMFYLWEIGQAGATDYDIHDLLSAGHVSPAALDMSVHDIIHQFCEVNGGEVWLTTEDDPRPWIVRRTELNSDGTEPKLWSFFVADESEARMWVSAGQAEECFEAT